MRRHSYMQQQNSCHPTYLITHSTWGYSLKNYSLFSEIKPYKVCSLEERLLLRQSGLLTVGLVLFVCCQKNSSLSLSVETCCILGIRISSSNTQATFSNPCLISVHQAEKYTLQLGLQTGFLLTELWSINAALLPLSHKTSQFWDTSTTTYVPQ